MNYDAIWFLVACAAGLLALYAIFEILGDL